MTEATAEDLETISDIVKDADVAIVTSTAADGALHSRPFAVKDDAFSTSLRFLILNTGEVASDIVERPQVNVALQTKAGYLSLAGTATVTDEPAQIDELWSTAAQAWFPEGREDPAIAVLVVTPSSAEFWALDDAKPVAALKVIRAVFRREEPDIGTQKSVEL